MNMIININIIYYYNILLYYYIIIDIMDIMNRIYTDVRISN